MRRSLQIAFLLVILHIPGTEEKPGRRVRWVDAVVSDEEWKTDWEQPIKPPVKATSSPKPQGFTLPPDVNNNNEVVGTTPKPLLQWDQIKYLVMAPAFVVGVLLCLACLYCCCLKKRQGSLCAECCKPCSRYLLEKYMPGAQFDDKGNIEYRSIASEEAEAMVEAFDKHLM